MLNNLLKLADEYEDKLKNIYLLNRKLESPKAPAIFESDIDHLSHEDILMLLGITPLTISNDVSSYLGEGGYSTVYRVIYKGKPAVAKITTNYSDIDNLVKLFNLKNTLGDLSKHIANVYATFEFQNYFIAVVEELVMINPHVRAALFSIKKSKKLNILKRFDDKFFVTNFVNNLIEMADPPFVSETHLKKLKNNLNILFLKEKFDSEMTIQFITGLCQDVQTLILYNLSSYEDKEIMKFVNRVTASLTMILNSLRFDFGSVFPENSEGYNEVLANALPEAKSLMKLLYKLKDMGIRWQDLHAANIMERPKTRELVISDPGLFKM